MSVGPKGDKGDQGDIGETGETGHTGATGSGYGVEVAVALLGAKIDANQSETNAKLDGVTALVSERLTHLDKKIDAQRESDETKFTNINTDIGNLRNDVGVLQREGSKADGERAAGLTFFGLIVAAIGVFGGWLAHSFTLLLK